MRISYMVTANDGTSVPGACFDSRLLETADGLCEAQRDHLANVPDGYVPWFIDLAGTYSQAQLDEEKFETLISLALERMNIDSTGECFREIVFSRAVYLLVRLL